MTDNDDRDAWHRLSTDELKAKRTALKKLVDDGQLMDTTKEREQAEIAIIDAVLEEREARGGGD